VGSCHSCIAWLQGEILQLSEKYVRSLARDSRNVVDGPFAGRLTGYGMFTCGCCSKSQVTRVLNITAATVWLHVQWQCITVFGWAYYLSISPSYPGQLNLLP